MPTAASRRFSFSSRRVQAAFAAAALLLLGALVYVMAFAGDGDEQRESVSEYVLAVNRVERRLVVALREVGNAYQDIRLDAKAPDEQVARLEEAERTLADLRERVAALGPPPEAGELHAELLRLLDLQVAYAGAGT